jgi:hypothetical protein
MSYFLFVDESGQDRRDSPYEVLAGVAIEDRLLWPLITAIQRAELNCFGCRYTSATHELKAKKLLNRKVFRLAAQMPLLGDADRQKFARKCLEQGESAGRRELTALAQAKLEYVRQVLLICADCECRVFASIAAQDAPRPSGDFLRKDYAYVFERFFYYLEDMGRGALGLVVFDELEKSKSHVLIGQMSRYFLETRTGRSRAGRVIPEPFFVHSDLTTAIQVADLVAYIIAWGWDPQSTRRRIPKPARPELDPFTTLVGRMRYFAVRARYGNPRFGIWSFAYLKDLRPRTEQPVVVTTVSAQIAITETEIEIEITN